MGDGPYAFERDEWRAALRHAPLDCYQHRYVTDGLGRGSCAYCGASVDREEM